MQQEIIDKIKNITADLAETIDEMKPNNSAEWDAKEVLTAAHKQLRKINPDSFSEMGRKASFTR